jgi:Zn-dependent peptidase ImmA (M78 family)/transcriptional regulator with XRE-family HTH domain
MRYDQIDLPTLAERLVAARKAANVTQEAAANYLKMSRPTLIAIEKAARRPKPEELIKLAELYKEPLNKLLREDARAAQVRPHLRSILDTESGGEEELQGAVTQLGSYVDDYQYLEKLLEAKPVTHFPPPVKVGPGPVERFAEHCAQEERARLKLGVHQPISTPRKILEEAGLHVFLGELDSKLAGLYVFVPDFGYCILVNRQHPKERRHWTIAHEYGHFLIDRDRPGVDYVRPMQRKPENERFADAFANAFLMPEPGVQRRFYEEVERSGDFKVADLCRTADHFAVSLMAMSLRLEALGLIPRGSWDNISESRVPPRTLKERVGTEPRDDDSEDPYPQRYKLLAVQAFEADKITEGQLAKLLRCSRIQAREIVEQYSNTSDEGDSAVPISLAHSLLAQHPG